MKSGEKNQDGELSFAIDMSHYRLYLLNIVTLQYLIVSFSNREELLDAMDALFNLHWWQYLLYRKSFNNYDGLIKEATAGFIGNFNMPDFDENDRGRTWTAAMKRVFAKLTN